MLSLTQDKDHVRAACPLRLMRPNTSALVPRVKGILAGGPHAWDVIRQANLPLHSVYLDDHYSLLVPLLPLMMESAPYAYAWAALGAVYIAQQDSSPYSKWRDTAMQCYSVAIRGLCHHLQSSPVPHEWALCAVLLLHVFEKFGSVEQPPSHAHVQSMRTIFLRRFSACPPTSLRHMLELESLVYRLAITSTFRRSGGGGGGGDDDDDDGDDDTVSESNGGDEYRSLDDLVGYWLASDVPRGMWQHSLLLSLPPTLFNVVFKVSVLIRQWPLDAQEQYKLQCQKDALENMTAPFCLSSTAGSLHEVGTTADCEMGMSLVDQTTVAYELYSCACQLIITRLEQPATCCTGISQAARKGLDLLHQLNSTDFISLVLVWPATIIGLAAVTGEDQRIVTTYIHRAEPMSGSRTAASVTRLLRLAWTAGDERLRGINALLDNEAVRGVYL